MKDFKALKPFDEETEPARLGAESVNAAAVVQQGVSDD